MKSRLFCHLTILLCLSACASAAGWRPLLPVFSGAVYGIAVDAGGTLYITTAGGIFKSANGGQTWISALGNLPSPPGGSLAADPNVAGKVFVSLPRGLYVTTNSGGSWTQSLANVQPVWIAVGKANSNYVYVSTNGSYVQVSSDGGSTWLTSSNGLSGGWSGPSVTSSMAVDPTNSQNAFTNTWRGLLFKTTNGGTSWTQISDSNTWASNQIFIAPAIPCVMYMIHDQSSFGRGTVLRSADCGNTWPAVASPDGTPNDTYSLAISPSDVTGNTVYAATGQGVYKTTNGGNTWTKLFAPSTGPATMYPVSLDPTNASRVYAGSTISGFYRSTDGGSTWTQQNSGIAAATIHGLDLSPRTSPSPPYTIYAGISGQGFTKSTDTGSTWTACGNFQNDFLSSLGVHAQNPNTVNLSFYDGSQSYIWHSEDGCSTFPNQTAGYSPGWFRFNPFTPTTVHASIQDYQGGFFRSTDTGRTWTIPQSSYIYVGDYTFHPTLSNVILSVGNQYTGSATNTPHVLFSNDGGSTWPGSVAFGQGNFFDAALDQNNPSALYVAGQIPSEGTQGIYRNLQRIERGIGYSGARRIQ
jgi:photosystem II stability/assembly factor-like uncharacterized protein